jgi:hypothetical protein
MHGCAVDASGLGVAVDDSRTGCNLFLAHRTKPAGALDDIGDVIRQNRKHPMSTISSKLRRL